MDHGPTSRIRKPAKCPRRGSRLGAQVELDRSEQRLGFHTRIHRDRRASTSVRLLCLCGVQDFAVLAARFAGVRTASAGVEVLSASTVVTKRIP